MRRHKILVVDDEVPNLRLLRRVLSADHDILEAESGAAALKMLEVEGHGISLIITDQRMPSMTGVQLLEQSLEINPDAIKILLTGYTDVQALIDAINEGKIYKYIPKPWDAEELKLTVRRALEAFELKENNDRLLIELSQALNDLESVSVGTIRALADALDAKCDYTAGHSLRVSRFAVLIGRQLGLSNDHLRDVELGGILHDIGKIGVPESILWKPGALTPEEKAIMSKHPVTSAEIIGDLKGLVRAREYVKHHHEYYDGTGYPDGLEGETIPIGARIILVSDAYDAMTTDRPYRQAIGHDKAIAELKKMAGKQFDPRVVDALLAFIGDDGREIDRILAQEFPDSFIGLSLPSVDPSKTGRQYRAEAERQARLAGIEAGT
jgi:putative two-component system response regulator